MTIPKTFTCDGLDVSPQLSWNDPPATTQSFALIMDDPDAPAGTWVHWVLYNLPISARELAENIPNREQLSNGAHQGRNDFNKFGYGGPCPPPGKPHRYYFKLYALDTKLHLKPGAIKADVERAMQDHIRAQSQLIGLHSRKQTTESTRVDAPPIEDRLLTIREAAEVLRFSTRTVREYVHRALRAI